MPSSFIGFFIPWKLTELCRFVTFLWNDTRIFPTENWLSIVWCWRMYWEWLCDTSTWLGVGWCRLQLRESQTQVQELETKNNHLMKRMEKSKYRNVNDSNWYAVTLAFSRSHNWHWHTTCWRAGSVTGYCFCAYLLWWTRRNCSKTECQNVENEGPAKWTSVKCGTNWICTCKIWDRLSDEM